MSYTNTTQLPLSMAVYLATDHYDYIPNTISATGLLRPIRQSVLNPRVPKEDAFTDVLSLVKARLGTSIHDGIEKAWMGDYKAVMASLGYPAKVIDRIKVNPSKDELGPSTIPVYMEQRLFREHMGYSLSGKFDFVADGALEDFKTTSTFTWVNGTKDADYQLQGSIYRWLDPVLINKDHITIQFIFTDWMPGRAMQDPKYPQRQVESKNIPLLSLEETEQYITDKLTQLNKYRNTAEPDLPLCTDKELWRHPPQYKYYKNPQKMARSTKNFADRNEAYNRLAKDGGTGVVIEKPGEVVACKYCQAFSICSQKDQLIADGSLTVI